MEQNSAICLISKQGNKLQIDPKITKNHYNLIGYSNSKKIGTSLA